MVLVLIWVQLIKINIIMKVIGWMIKNIIKEFIVILMEIFMKVNGRMVKDMVMVYMNIRVGKNM